MENQHRQIKGYRELTQAEIDLMNEIKMKGVELQHLLTRVRIHVGEQENIAHKADSPDEMNRLFAAEPLRWAELAQTHIQLGLMALTRSVAQPTFF